jgi:lipopolysaccharide biosynthesis glycosyltransferase
VETIKVFIGSGEASLVERKVLIHSIRKNTTGPVEINVFNGTHDSLEKDNNPPTPLGMPLNIKYTNVTEFSNYRFMIPQLCNYQGRAIFVDSDTIAVGDLRDLWNTEMNGFDFLAKGDAYATKTGSKWGLSVTLFDCSKSKFDLKLYFSEIEAGKYTYTDLHQMSALFLEHHPFKIGQLDPKWNDFDNFDKNTKLIHYTNLYTQPWKQPGHPHGKLWFDYYSDALRSGVLLPSEVERAVYRSYVRHDLKYPVQSELKYYLKGLYRTLRKKLKK